MAQYMHASLHHVALDNMSEHDWVHVILKKEKKVSHNKEVLQSLKSR